MGTGPSVPIAVIRTEVPPPYTTYSYQPPQYYPGYGGYTYNYPPNQQPHYHAYPHPPHLPPPPPPPPPPHPGQYFPPPMPPGAYPSGAPPGVYSPPPNVNAHHYPGSQTPGVPPRTNAPPRPPQAVPPSQYPHSAPAPSPPAADVQTTSTIKNQVNLRKQTLKLVPATSLALGSGAVAFKGTEGEAQVISFRFDASNPCRVSTFVMAREDPLRGSQMTSKCSLGTPIYYDKGMNLEFPPPRDAAAAAANCICPSAHSLEELTSVQTHAAAGKQDGLGSASISMFPVVIRLETLTDKGREEGRRLEDLPSGADLPPWVQAQTTYARLVRDDPVAGSKGDHWSARVLKQKIWVNGTHYELQEIFGMEQQPVSSSGSSSSSGKPGDAGGAVAASSGAAAAAGDDDDGLTEGTECVICLSEARDTTVLPCRHMCMCSGCASALRSQTNKCPICRNPIESLLHIRITRDQVVKS